MTKKEYIRYRNAWIRRSVHEWEKKAGYKYWENLSKEQRKILTKDIKAKFLMFYEMGIDHTILGIKSFVKKEQS